jgi:general secretion pathway protein K
MHPKPKISHRGSALISALFIMTLVAIAATAMSTRLQFDIYRTHLTVSSDQLYLATQAVTFWGMSTINDEGVRFKRYHEEGKIISFPAKYQRLYPDITIGGDVYDLQAFFNVNNLQDKKFHPLFFRLLEQTFNQKGNANPKALLLAIYHWISPYQPRRNHDNHPFFPSNQPMRSVSELLLVPGFNNEIYQTLLPSISALPEVTPININTAPKWLLSCLGNGLSETQVNELIDERGKNGFTNIGKAVKILQKLDIPNDQITTESNYFLIVATATSDNLNLTSYTIIKHRKDPQGNMTMGVVSESLNTM